jgi:hypothetical protein
MKEVLFSIGISLAFAVSVLALVFVSVATLRMK